jgi:hypothetical protein
LLLREFFSQTFYRVKLLTNFQCCLGNQWRREGLIFESRDHEKMGMGDLWKNKIKKIIIMVKYLYIEHIIIIIWNENYSIITYKL